MAEDYRETLKTSGQTLVGDTLAEAITFNAQCFLIQHMFAIAPKAQEVLKLTIEKRRTTPPSPGQTNALAPLSSGDEAEVSGYRYVAPLLSTTQQPPAYTFSNLVKPTAARTMIDLTTDKMAMLVPRMRLYKVEYESLPPDDEGMLRPNLDKSRDIEVIFDDFVRGESLEKMFEQRKGRISGTGIKSFKWSLKGVNPADVDKNIEAQLTIHFNDVAEIFTDQNRQQQFQSGRAGKASFLDLIIYAPHKALAEDVGTPSSETSTLPTYLHYDGKFFEIRAEVGWQVPPAAATLFSSAEMEMIKGTRTPLFLQLAKHRFNFNQDASADLVIDYRARYANLENRFDLFGIPDNLDLQKNLENLRTERERWAELEHDEMIKATDEKIEAAQLKLNNYLDERYSRIVQQLIKNNRLLDAFATPLQLRAFRQTAEGGAAPRPMSEDEYRFLVEQASNKKVNQRRPEEAMLAAGADGSKPFFEYMTSRARFYEDLDTGGFWTYQGKVVPHEQLVALEAEEGLYRSRTAEALEGEDVEDPLPAPMAGFGPTRAPLSFEWSQNSSWNWPGRAPIASSGTPMGPGVVRPGGTEPVTFFLLGDLLEAAIRSNPEGYQKEIASDRSGLITLDLEFLNLQAFYDAATGYISSKPATEDEPARRAQLTRSPKQFFKKLRFRELSFSRKDKKQLYKPINIASIPIQYDAFVDWYIKKVVKPQRRRYYINHFIADVLRDLVMPLLSARCFYGIPQTHYHLTQLDVLADRESAFSEAVYTKKPQPGSNTTFISDLMKNKDLPLKVTVESPKRSDYGPQVHRHFKVLTVTDPGNMSFQQGDPAEDRENGVYHFIIGSDRGLLKSATFQRVDAPHLPEARIDRDRVAGAEQLRELYNVTLKLYGAPLIKPGQYIYVSPSPIGFGDPKSLNSVSRYLGIGGYHLVTSVENTISAKGYETTVKALHQAMPYLKNTPDLI